MRPNVKQFVQLLADALELPTPVVDIGSLRTEGQESYADLRPFFAEGTYTGVDMRHGVGVECLGSAHSLPLADQSIGTLLMLDTLEHVLDPLAAAREVSRVVRPGGVVVLSSHMNFPIHAYPSDYWRFTPMIFDYLVRAVPHRFIFMQGDAENPHTVIAAGMTAAEGGVGAAIFRSTVRDVQERWPEESHGGPLYSVEPLDLVVSQRIEDRDLPELAAGYHVEQEFVCPRDSLRRIDVKMSNLFGLTYQHIVFRVREAIPDGREIACHRVLAWHVLHSTWVPISLPLQPDAAGRKYVISIESHNGTPGRSVSPRASSSTVYEDGRLLVNGEETDGSLCFQLFCAAAESAVLDPWSVQEAERKETIDDQPRVEGVDGVWRWLRVLEERQREHVAYIGASAAAGFDGLRYEMREFIESQQREMRELIESQRVALALSEETAELVREIQRNPLMRVWRLVRGRTDGGAEQP